MLDGDRRPSITIQRGFYVGAAVVIASVAVAGFWPTYWGPFFSGTLDKHWLLHLHAGVFTVWLFLLITQTGLVRRGRTDLHQKLGAALGSWWGALLVVVGLSTALGVASPGIGEEFGSLQAFIESLGTTLPSISAFGVLFAAGIVYRKRPAVHKRLMVFATLVLLDAATARLGPNLLGMSSPGMIALIGLGVPAGLGLSVLGHDWWTRRRIHPASLVGGGILLLSESRLFLIRSDAWTEFSGEAAATLRSVLLPLM